MSCFGFVSGSTRISVDFFEHNAEIGQVGEPARLRKDRFRMGTN